MQNLLGERRDKSSPRFSSFIQNLFHKTNSVWAWAYRKRSPVSQRWFCLRTKRFILVPNRRFSNERHEDVGCCAEALICDSRCHVFLEVEPGYWMSMTVNLTSKIAHHEEPTAAEIEQIQQRERDGLRPQVTAPKREEKKEPMVYYNDSDHDSYHDTKLSYHILRSILQTAYDTFKVCKTKQKFSDWLWFTINWNRSSMEQWRKFSHRIMWTNCEAKWVSSSRDIWNNCKSTLH